MYACNVGYIDIVTELLNHNPNIEHRDENGHSALFEAVYEGNIEIVRLLLSRGAIVNESSSDGKLIHNIHIYLNLVSLVTHLIHYNQNKYYYSWNKSNILQGVHH